jgi:hypothetical protein
MDYRNKNVDMIKNRNTTIGLIIASIAIQLFIQIIKGREINIPEILGGTLAMMLLPYLLTLLIRLISKAFSWDFNEIVFFKTFFAIWIIVALSNIVAANDKSADQSSTTDRPLTFKYSPEGSIYEIEFMTKPKISEISTTDGKAILKAEVAELVMTEDKGYIKSEFIILGKDTVKHFSTDALYSILKQYSISNGLSNPEFRNSENELGKQVDLRGYKTLKDEDLNERHLIMTAHLYFKENNVMILYGVSEAKDYPTPGITKFLNSIRLK